jgi:hypothetical protein
MAELNEGSGNMIRRLLEQYVDESTSATYVALVTEDETTNTRRIAGICYLIMLTKLVVDDLEEGDKEGRKNVWHIMCQSFYALGISEMEIHYAIDYGIPVLMNATAPSDEMHWSPDTNG